jgi:hypothetical protein
MGPPIFNQRLPKYDQRQKGRQHQRCEHHLDDCETDRVFAKKPTCNNAASCLCRKLNSTIMVVKAIHDRHRCDAAFVLDGAKDRGVFAKRLMSPQLVIISGISR